MGFFKKLLFGEQDEKITKLNQEIRENVENGADYSCALTENQIKCNGCGQDIEGKPRIKDHMGKTMYFHKRCWKKLMSGQLPVPITENDKTKS
jgi:hypothetical protein